MSIINVDTIADEPGTGGPDFTAMPSVGGDLVVESGSNSDGLWTRFADGTQTCYNGADSGDDLSGPSPVVWTFPAAFSDNNYGYALDFVTSDSSSVLWMSHTYDPSTTDISISKYDTSGSQYSNSFLRMSALVVGRWK